MNKVDTPTWTLLWGGTDATEALKTMVASLTYSDKKAGESDELSITVEDHDARWRNEWMPAKGDVLELAIGYEQRLVDAGRYEIDQIEYSGPPDKLAIHALAAGITTDLRTKRNTQYVKKTLPEIAAIVAARHAMTVIGSPDTDVIDYTAQSDQNDLEFLSKISADFGYIFSIKGKSLVFMSDDELMSGPIVETISMNESDVINWHFVRKSEKIYKDCEVTYFDPATKKTQRVIYPPHNKPNREASQDTLKKRLRVQDKAQALAKAEALLKRANIGEITVTLAVYGRPTLAAGINIKLNGFGSGWDDTYHVQKSTHQFDAQKGYTTTIEVQRV